MSDSRFQGDVLLATFPFASAVEVGAFSIEISAGIVTMTPGFETAVALSLFGGNFGDDGIEGNLLTYWGNLIEDDPAFKYLSRTQHLLQSLPATSANLRLVEEAARLDLAWFKTKQIANEINVAASIPSLNRIQLDVEINAVGEISNFTFTENWVAAV